MTHIMNEGEGGTLSAHVYLCNTFTPQIKEITSATNVM